MNDGEALLKAILANPDEDTPRLVYADWLDENDQPERAEFIRVQIELAAIEPGHWEYGKVKREFDLLDANTQGTANWFVWSGIAGLFIAAASSAHLSFCRGFVESIACKPDEWLAHADAILGEHPVRHVTLDSLHQEHMGFGLIWPNIKFGLRGVTRTEFGQMTAETLARVDETYALLAAEQRGRIEQEFQKRAWQFLSAIMEQDQEQPR